MSRKEYNIKIKKYLEEPDNISGQRVSVISKRDILLKFTHHHIKCSIDVEEFTAYVHDMSVDLKKKTLKSYMDQVIEYLRRDVSYINITVSYDIYESIGELLEKFNEKDAYMRTIDTTDDSIEISIGLRLFYELTLFYNINLTTK